VERNPPNPLFQRGLGGFGKRLHQKPGGPGGYLQDRVEVTATDKRGERIEVMTITEWIIRLSIFGVLALAVLGTVQNLVDAMRKKS
jgi:hypothetical protein